MPKCGQCEDGWVYYDEDGRRVRDACYHCGNTGFIDEATAFLDRLQCAAEFLARLEVDELRRLRNEDPEGEDWAFCAAECMMSPHDYYVARVMDRAHEIGRQFADLPEDEAKVYVAWMDAVDEAWAQAAAEPPKVVDGMTIRPVEAYEEPPSTRISDDDIPF
jgi:hypothetical protein